MDSNYDNNYQSERKNNFEKLENHESNYNDICSSNGFSKISLIKEEKEKQKNNNFNNNSDIFNFQDKFYKENSNINENDLFSLTKDNFFNTASTFFIKDYINLNSNNKIFENSTREFNNKYNNNNKFLLDKKSKSDIDIKYNYYLSNLNKELNNSRDNKIQENENIQKLLEEEKNIEEENLKRLTELRVKYLSSIKTFDFPIKENYQINNNLEKLNFKSEKKDYMANNDININSNNPAYSFDNKLIKQANSLVDINKSPNNLMNNKNISLFSNEKNTFKNNYNNYISNILSPKQMGNYNNNNELNYNKKENQIINNIGSISNQSLNEDEDIIRKKSEINNFNNISNKEIKNEEIIIRENIINKDLNKSSLNNSFKINNILKDEKINMSIYERNNEKNKYKTYNNTEQNINNENDINYKLKDSFGEKNQRNLDYNNSKDYLEEKEKEKLESLDNIKIYQQLENKDNNIKEDKLKNINLDTNNNNIPKQQKQNINEINEKYYLKENKDINIINKKNDNFNYDLIYNYKILELDYNKIQLEYNTLKKNYIELLDNYNAEKNKKNIQEEKSLFNEYIIKENNSLRLINSNYEYIITPLINYINDINYFINRKKIKKIDLVKLNQNIRNINNTQNTNENISLEEHPLYSFIQLLNSYKNIILNDESINTNMKNYKNKSIPKKINTYDTYESIMKNYNLKSTIVFKPKKSIKETKAKSIVLTPNYSKSSKSHKIFDGKVSKTEKYNSKNKGKIEKKRKQIINKILKKDSSSLTKKSK